MHKNYCEICRIDLKDQGEFKKHVSFEHAEIVSPQAKKRKRDSQTESINNENDTIVTNKDIRILEKESWEESRLNHREIEAKVNEEELDQMETFNVNKKTSEINVKLKIRKMEEENDKKVLNKQVAWFEEEVRFQEMKRKMLEDRIEGENKRKRQLSMEKKKKMKAKKEKIVKENFDDIIDLVKDNEKVEESSNEGPGYMGWKSGENNAMDIIEAFQDIRNQTHIMDMKIQELEKDKTQQRNDIKALKKEINNLKDEYKQCLDALSKETY